MDELITLYRPIGKSELDLIEQSGFEKFPPRLPDQPIFYPVLNEEYAERIARDWNARLNDDRLGFVTRFEVKAEFLKRFDVQIVGGSQHEEYWIPSEDLPEFNRNIVGKIEIIKRFEGS